MKKYRDSAKHEGYQREQDGRVILMFNQNSQMTTYSSQMTKTIE